MINSALALKSYEFSDDQNILYKKSANYELENSQSFSSPLKHNLYNEREETPLNISDDTIELPQKNQLSASELKRINREISRKISPETKNKLIEARQALAIKKFQTGLTKKEENRLKLIDWELDRIDDAELGEELDSLEYFVNLNEQFACELKDMMLHFQKEGLIRRKK
ncbi:MAG: hypothetical protein K9L30_18305 [Desulfobacterales bacterium]|nr:hypothetical protein [Desulfobacterales bacterium]